MSKLNDTVQWWFQSTARSERKDRCPPESAYNMVNISRQRHNSNELTARSHTYVWYPDGRRCWTLCDVVSDRLHLCCPPTPLFAPPPLHAYSLTIPLTAAQVRPYGSQHSCVREPQLQQTSSCGCVQSQLLLRAHSGTRTCHHSSGLGGHTRYQRNPSSHKRAGHQHNGVTTPRTRALVSNIPHIVAESVEQTRPAALVPSLFDPLLHPGRPLLERAT